MQLAWCSFPMTKPSRRRSMTSSGVAKSIATVPSQFSADLWVHTRAIQFGKDNGLDTSGWEEAAARAARNLSPILTISVCYKALTTGPSGISRSQTRCWKERINSVSAGRLFRHSRAYAEGDEQLAIEELAGATYEFSQYRARTVAGGQ